MPRLKVKINQINHSNQQSNHNHGTVFFQEYVDGEFITIEGTDSDAAKEKKKFFLRIIDFFKSMFELLKKLFSGASTQ